MRHLLWLLMAFVLHSGMELQFRFANALAAPASTGTKQTLSINRRGAIRSGAAAAAAVSSVLIVGVAAPTKEAAAAAASVVEPTAAINELLDKLKGIPTFCIVNKENGGAYMAFKNDQAMAIGYAFTTFSGALAVLGDAQRNAKQKGYYDVWENAAITTIPLDIAVRLALKKKERKSQKDQSLDTLLMVIPGADDRQDGIAIDSKFKDQGRVPLFYLENNTDDTVSFYFARKDLVANWNKLHPGVDLPPVKAVDLVGIFENIMRGRSGYLPSTNCVFVPTEDSLSVAQELKSRGLAPYNPNRMII